MSERDGFHRLGNTRTAPDTATQGLYRKGIKAAGIRDFPGTDEGRFFWDIAQIQAVDAKTKTLRLRTLRMGLTPSKVEYVSLMFDPTNGNGVYITPKPGMTGIYWEIDGKGFFGPMTGVMEGATKNGYSNDREEAPAGSFVARTGRETKLVMSPNLVLLQAANFCKILMKRVNKLIDGLFYSLRLTSLAGSINWFTKLKERTALFSLKIRDRLPRRQDFLGRLEKADDAVEVQVRAGNVTKDIGAQFRLARAKGPGDKISLEGNDVRAFRLLVRDLFEKRGIASFTDLKKDDNQDILRFPENFSSPQDTSLDLVLESIVDAASYVSRATPEAKNGVKHLSPSADSVEALSTAALTALGKRKPEELNPETEFFVPANPIENAKAKDGDSVLKDIVSQARGAKGPKEEAELRTRFRADVMKKDGSLDVNQPDGATTWHLDQLFQLAAKRGPVDIDAGDGIRIQARNGVLVLGNGVAGIALGKDGIIRYLGKGHRFITYKDVPSTGLDAVSAAAADVTTAAAAAVASVASGTDAAASAQLNAAQKAQAALLKKKVKEANRFEILAGTMTLKVDGDLNLEATGNVNLKPKQPPPPAASTTTVGAVRNSLFAAAGISNLPTDKVSSAALKETISDV